VDQDDGAYLLGTLAGIGLPSPPDCPAVFQDVTADGVPREWGDLNCLQTVTIGDVLSFFLHLAGLIFQKAVGCPDPDQLVQVTWNG
jgi:hypothetical protein